MLVPINYGNKIRVFVLEQQVYLVDGEKEEGRGTSYNTEIWKPKGAAIKGKYDDYGCIEKIVEDQNTNALLADLRKNTVGHVEEERARILSIKVKPEDLKEASLEELLRHIERGHLRYKNRYGIDVQLGLFMVLEDVYKDFVTWDPIGVHHLGDRIYKYVPYSEILNHDFESYYNKLLLNAQDQAKIALETDKESRELQTRLQDAIFDLMTITMDQRIFDSMYGPDMKNLQNQLLSLVKELVPFSDEKVQNIVSLVKETISFNSSMSLARKQWAPQTGKGSQNNELDIYKLINKCTDKIIKKREKENIKEGGDKPNKRGYYSYMLKHNAQLEKNNGSQKEVSTETTE